MTTTIDRAGTHTPEDLLTMPDGDREEVLPGFSCPVKDLFPPV